MLKDILTGRSLVICEPHTKISDVAKLMEKEDVGSVLVLTQGRPRGIITDRDIVLRCIAKNVDVEDCTVENVMTEALHTVKETDGIFDCIRKMNEAKVRRIPVVNSRGEAVGLISFGDLMAVLGKEVFDLSVAATPKLALKPAA